jgi:sphinganine-1-phosphate aldolase
MSALDSVTKTILSKEYVPLFSILFVFLFNKSHRLFSAKNLAPIVVGTIVYRALSDESEDLLSTVNKIFAGGLPPFYSKMISFLIGDLFGITLCLGVLTIVYAVIWDVTHPKLSRTKQMIVAQAFNLVKDLGFVKKMLEKEQTKLEEDFEKDLKVKSRAIGEMNKSLPAVGMAKSAILKLMKDATATENVKWESGRISGAVYHGKHDHINLLNEAFGLYSIANPLHPDIWPSVMKFESEIISMTKSLVDGGLDTVCGCTTSGGTESIILAIKAHRDYYREHHGIHNPEMIVATSAHAAVDKACDLMNIRLIKLEPDPVTFRMNLPLLMRSITPNTIMMYASAPSYPHGAIDPITEMSKIAVDNGIGLHVDCCLGGFVLPFAKRLGYNIPDFDFGLPGVTSMSLDTHKYGYALKGASVCLYRTKELRHSQYFCYADWTGGMYTTPTIAGSRSGGLIAQCWASMMALGDESYLQHTREIMDVCRSIAEGVKNIPGLRLLGDSEAMIVCFDGTDEKTNVYKVADQMSSRGWSLNSLQNPPCVHICCTVTHVGKDKEFLADLLASAEYVQNNPNIKGGNAAIYGMTSALPSGPVNELLKVYNDVVLKV